MNSLYEIPKLNIPVEISLINGEVLRGKVFIYQDLDEPGGKPTLEKLLSKEPEKFIPFQSTAGNYRLINKNQIIFVRTFEDNSDIRNRTPLSPQSLVVYFVNEQSMFGALYPTQAEESRVSDIMNNGDQFIAIYHDEQKIIINCDQIIYISSN